mgnify:CR=1 FL=1
MPSEKVLEIAIQGILGKLIKQENKENVSKYFDHRQFGEDPGN